MSRHSLFTSNFKKNVIFCCKLLVAVFLLCAYIYHVLPQYEQSYNAALLDKVDRLKSTDSPKIVLIGHSNLAFGIDSEMIEEALEMPVVNMGLHGGNGNAFHEEMAKMNVCPGDIYVLCHSSYDDDNTITDPVNTWTTIENHFNLWRLLRLSDAENMAKAFPVYLKKSLALYSEGAGNEAPEGVYSRNAFNEYGDVAVERYENLYSFDNWVSAPKVGEETVKRINELNSYLTGKGASLVVAGYPIGKGEKTVSVDEFVAFQNQLTERLDCPVISNFTDYMFDYSYFYDTEFHLTSEGAALRTEQLIEDLKSFLQ